MRLSEHFSLEELTISETAERLNIDNTPPLGIVKRLIGVAVGLEQVRVLLGHPIHINSGYRCEELNKAVGGAKQSAHIEGWAADFICPEFGTPMDIARKIEASDIEFDKCIQEGNWVHISFMPHARRITLTAHFGENGTTYTKGV
jgi:zinc D-Ala-D-Ala carboxypeptidase